MRRLLLALLTLVVLVPTGLIAPTASAEEVRVTDPTGDGGRDDTGGGPRVEGDVAALRVHHGERALRLGVEHAPGARVTDYYNFWVDTRPRRQGPELLITVYGSYRRQVTVNRTTKIGGTGGERVCVRRTTRFGPGGIVRTVVPRSCLAHLDGTLPDAVRVLVQSESDYGPGDWAPGHRVYTPWLAAG